MSAAAEREHLPYGKPMAYTVNVAKQLKLDYKTGSISVGKLADFAVIDRDVINCPVQELKKIKVEQTWFCGNRGI